MCQFDTHHIPFRPPSCPHRAAKALWCILYIVWECTSRGCQLCCINPSKPGVCLWAHQHLLIPACCSPMKLFPCCHSPILIPLQTGGRPNARGYVVGFRIGWWGVWDRQENRILSPFNPFLLSSSFEGSTVAQLVKLPPLSAPHQIPAGQKHAC